MADLTLSQAQRAFTRCVGQLILWTYEQGLEITLGEAWRSTATARVMAEQGRGIVTSLHIDRLAIDLLLWKEGQYQTQTEAYQSLGTYWKSLHALAAWGGDFMRLKDGNHFSFRWGGRA